MSSSAEDPVYSPFPTKVGEESTASMSATSKSNVSDGSEGQGDASEKNTKEVGREFIEPRCSKGRAEEALAEFTVNKLQFSSVGLIGRDCEVAILQDCLKRLKSPSSNKRELVFISGKSGTGKTVLSRSLENLLHRYHGFYISGKFDIELRGLPYAGIVSACGELCADILNSSQRTKIQIAVEKQLGSDLLTVLTKVLPMLEEVVQVPPDIENTTIGYNEAKNQFHYAFRRFLTVIGSFAPLILVLDDLQWADTETLELLEVLITDRDNKNLMIIGIYRSDEVDERHVLTKMKQQFQDSNTKAEAESTLFNITEISVGNLGVAEVNQMLVKLLSRDDTQDLAKICHKKTHGNAFFLVYFLTMLEKEKLLEYNFGLMKWVWDESDIEAKTKATDNVIDLIKEKMNDLPEGSSRLLQKASFLGSTFDERTLIIITDDLCGNTGASNELIKINISAAVKEGILEQCGTSRYCWVHDKIKEGANSLIPPDEIKSLSYSIGESLSSQLTEEELYAEIFAVANLLNEVSLSSNKEKSLKKAQLNLQASKKAISVSAFDCAASYCREGVKCLPSNKWEGENYKLTLDLFSTAVEMEACIGNDIEELCSEVLDQKNRPITDKLRVYWVLMDYMTNCDRTAEAMKLNVDVLRQLKCKFPKSNALATLKTVAGLVMTKNSAKSRTPEEISKMELMTDSIKIEAMRFLFKLGKLSYMEESPLLPLSTLRMLNYTLEYGLSDHSPATCALTGLMLSAFMGDLQGGSTYAQHALLLLDKLNSKTIEAQPIYLAHSLVLHMTRPVANMMRPLLKAYEIGLRTGDNEHAMYSIYNYILFAFQSGKSLSAIEEDCRVYTEQMKELKIGKCLTLCRLLWQTILNISGKSEDPFVLSGKAMNETEFLKVAEKDDFYLLLFRAYQTHLYALFGEHERGAELAIDKGDGLKMQHPGSPFVVTDTFFRGLSLFKIARKTKKKKYKAPAKKTAAVVRNWAKQGNPNVKHFESLLEAESLALEGKKEKAVEQYRRAIVSATRGGFLQYAAFAHEQYGEFVLSDMSDRVEATFRFKEAIKLYEEWGAVSKIEQLQKNHAELLQPPTQIELD